MTERGSRRSSAIRKKGLISTLEGTRRASVPVAPTDIYSFSQLQRRLIKTFVDVPTPWHAGGGEGFELTVGESNHRMAANLLTRGLDGARPMLLQYADPFQSLLFAGTEVQVNLSLPETRLLV